MFAGHFGLAAAVKASEKEVPLWALMAGAQLLDIVFIPFFLMGKETIVSVGGEGYGGALIHADYTHALVSALMISLLAGTIAWRVWSRRTGVVIGGIVFSHWLLDLIVHRPDLPVFPGNWGNLPLMGLGVWERPAVSMALEGLLIACGFLLYWRSALRRAALVGRDRKPWAHATAIVMGLLLLLSLLTDING